MEAVIIAIGSSLLIVMVGWLKLDINRLADRIDHLAEHLGGRIDHQSERIDGLSDRVARLEGRERT